MNHSIGYFERSQNQEVDSPDE